MEVVVAAADSDAYLTVTQMLYAEQLQREFGNCHCEAF